MVKISTSLLNANKEKIIQTIYDLEVAGTNYFHIDVMDGKFVENDTTNEMMQYTEYIKMVSNTPVDVHLMVKDVENYTKEYIDMNVDCITFHVESLSNSIEILKMIKYIKENNIKVGISLNPNTPIEDIYEYIPYIHKVLIMTVQAGKGGQKLIEETIEKIQKLNIFIYENNYDIDIEVDGGINEENAKTVIEAGANILVAGSYITNQSNYKDAINKLKNN